MPSPTLTAAMLSDLHKGSAAISIVPYDSAKGTYFVAQAASGGNDAIPAVSFATADQLFTLQDSLNFTSDDPSSEDVKIDQFQRIIDIINEDGGNWQVTGNVPSIATELFDYFFNPGVAIETAISGNSAAGSSAQTYVGKSYLNTKKSVEVAMLLESESRNTAIALAHVKLVVNFPAQEDGSHPVYLKFTASVLPNKATGQGDFAVLKAAAAA